LDRAFLLSCRRSSATLGMEIEDDDSSIDLRMKGPVLAVDIGF
jgi:hypothetical protein